MSFNLFSATDFTKEVAISHLPFTRDITVSVPLKPDANSDTNYSRVFRNKATASRLIQNIHPDLDTHPKLFNNAADMFGDRPCLGKRPYDYKNKTSAPRFDYFTYSEVKTKKNNIGAGFIRSLLQNPFLDSHLESHRKVVNHLRDWPTYGIQKSGRDNQDFEIEKSTSFILTIFAVNRLEWVLTDLACSSYSITNTALYDTLGPDVSQYILGLTESPIVVTTNDKIPVLLDLKRNYPKQTSSLISIVSMDPIDLVSQEWFDQAAKFNVTIQDLNQIEALGLNNPIHELPPNKDALFTISFTSGTTGSKPKGVMISQAGAAAYITSLTCIKPHAAAVGEKAFIFLPLTHLYERQTSAFAWSTGYYLGFPQLTLGQENINPFSNMLEDLRIFKPTYMSIVPRLLTRLEALIKSKIKELSPAEQDKVNQIIEYKIKEQGKRDGAKGLNAALDQYAPYKFLRELVGYDNIKWVQTASAPIAPSTLVYLKASLNMGIRQQYGLTESGAAITSTDDYEAQAGTCGPILPTGQLKLRSVRDMGYSIDNLEGEVMLQGPQMFKGYYYNKEETDNSINEDGWFHSGDIARIDPKTGRVSIIDRVKNFFKMQQGEYVSPERIENRYLSSNPQITQLYVHGNSLQTYLVGIVGVEYEKGLKFLNEEFGFNKIDISEHELLQDLNKIEIKSKFLEKMNHNVRGKLNGFEILHNIHIEINPLTVEREVVTPTFKLRRPVASKFFADVFHRLYEIEQSLLHQAKLRIAKL
ncbi:long-chain-fatty-acyl-CoA synthetase, putative [Candida dubliniensis CD36]|uniref:Long-chain-fatty-acyl-CoA synthetase, putative n=1 Tax=Candida dubliniensis (strain CD36 / ATCC MYA-646 / CBS 7987 / NCPF 3949 / NRRL Y-17841) TaxID=573826 RepID=B9WEH8_CANDC|nr:long-chain-fatty-acyl-CoA synthetase, putative [Candida dubliniensis CD36]CAX43090.1 long-chain-fatty-acyl-CoA synthetase, putative [Candida dubliniensis CD36]